MRVITKQEDIVSRILPLLPFSSTVQIFYENIFEQTVFYGASNKNILIIQNSQNHMVSSEISLKCNQRTKKKKKCKCPWAKVALFVLKICLITDKLQNV